MPPLTKELLPNGVLWLTMDRPEVRNAFDDHQIERLTQAIEAAAVDEQVRVLVLASKGKHFCAGGDLNYMRRMGTMDYEENFADAQKLARLMYVLNFFPKPTIIRVQGAAFGGGVGLISCGDIVIGSPFAKLSLSEVKIGMVPATIAPYVIKAIGQRAARRLFLTGELIEAKKGLDLGFLSEIVELVHLDQRVQEIADQIIQNAPQALAKAKKIIFDIGEHAIDDQMIQYTCEVIAKARNSAEGKEGLSAFLEKRKPNW